MGILRTVCNKGTRWGFAFFCPGCQETHSIPILPSARGWTFSGTEEAPTFAPSILVHPSQRFKPGTREVEMGPRCHSFVIAGSIQFLKDCTHPLAGQTVPLPEYKYDP
jgi:Family of unknown function (DUF6527)